MYDDAEDLGGVLYSGTGIGGYTETWSCFLRGYSGTRAVFKVVALALEKFEGGIECKGWNMPEDKAKRGKDIVTTGCRGGEVVLV